MDIALALLPIFAGFGLGFAAKHLRVVPKKTGDWLLKLAFYGTIPPLTFVSIASAQLSGQLLVFVLLPVVIMAIAFTSAWLINRRLTLARSAQGVLLTGPMGANTGFVLAFLLAAYQHEGAARVALYNAGNTPLLFSVVHLIAAAYNPEETGRKAIIRKILLSPPLWALAAGLLVNLTDSTLPSLAVDVFTFIGNLTGILTITALGILFNPVHLKFDTAALIVTLRMGLGLLVGIGLALLFGLHGMDQAALIALAAAPVGFNVMAFATIERLDSELAASAVSLSILISLVLTPIILFVAGA